MFAAQITNNLTMIIYTINIHKHVVHLLNLCQGECEQQEQDGDDDVVGIFVSKVQHVGNTEAPSIDVTNTESTAPLLWKQQSLVFT